MPSASLAPRAKVTEIASRERAAREVVGTSQEEEAFEALRMMIVSEARRINGLMYCAQLRCGIMPTRFDVLVQLERTHVDAVDAVGAVDAVDGGEKLKPYE